MTILVEGLNRIRDMINDDIDQGQLGTNGDLATEDDTSLGAAVTSTNLTVTKSTANKQINFSYTLPSTGGATNTYKEFELRKNATPVNYDRIVFTGISFTLNGTKNISVIKRYFIRNV